MYELVDLTKLDWTISRYGDASHGGYRKATNIERGTRYYYKCSTFYRGQNCFGEESIIEVIISRLLRKLGFNAAVYTLAYALVPIDGVVYRTYVCKSRNYFEPSYYDARITFEDMHRLSNGLDVFRLISDLGMRRSVEEMFVADFLTIQRDRHGANIELLRNKSGRYIMSPLFDNGLGLLAPYSIQCGADYKNFEPMSNLPVNNYIGYRDLMANLSFVTVPVAVTALSKSDKGNLFKNLSGVVPKDYIDKTWDIIWTRYNRLKDYGKIYEV